VLSIGLAALIALASAGCGGGGDGTTVQMTPEGHKKTQEYLQNYQKSMFEKHQKGAQKKPR